MLEWIKKNSAWNTLLVALFLLTQLSFMAYAQTTRFRYFCWSMYHTDIRYEFQVEVNGVVLDPEAFMQRYRFNRKGSDSRSAYHPLDLVQHRERLYGKGDHVKVVMNYREVGGEPQVLTWEQTP